jgi:hypothetical protein
MKVKKRLPYLPCKGIFSPEVYTIVDGKQVRIRFNAYYDRYIHSPFILSQTLPIGRGQTREKAYPSGNRPFLLLCLPSDCGLFARDK